MSGNSRNSFTTSSFVNLTLRSIGKSTMTVKIRETAATMTIIKNFEDLSDVLFLKSSTYKSEELIWAYKNSLKPFLKTKYMSGLPKPKVRFEKSELSMLSSFEIIYWVASKRSYNYVFVSVKYIVIIFED